MIRGGTGYSACAEKMGGSVVSVRRALKVDKQLLLGAIEKQSEEESDIVKLTDWNSVLCSNVFGEF